MVVVLEISLFGRLLDCGDGLADHVNDEFGVGERDDVTTVRLDDGRPHALRNKALQVRMHGAVILGHDEPGRFRLLSDAVGLWLLL